MRDNLKKALFHIIFFGVFKETHIYVEYEINQIQCKSNLKHKSQSFRNKWNMFKVNNNNNIQSNYLKYTEQLATQALTTKALQIFVENTNGGATKAGEATTAMRRRTWNAENWAPNLKNENCKRKPNTKRITNDEKQKKKKKEKKPLQ